MQHDNEEKLWKTAKFASKIIGVSTGTLRKWDYTGNIETKRLPSGHRLYNIIKFTNKGDGQNTGTNIGTIQKTKYIYARVSTKQQSDNLTRQIKLLQEHTTNESYKLVTDIGSGINFRRKGFKTILDEVMHGTVEDIMVTHKDRLSRFAFDLIQQVCSFYGTTITVLESDNSTKESELSEDLLSIITVFTARSNGRKRYSRKEN